MGTLDSIFKAICIMAIGCILLAMPGPALQAQPTLISVNQGSKVLFLEHYLLANGTVIEGESPFKSVNFPTYWYNDNTKQLNGQIDFPVDSSLKMIFGDVLTLHGNFGGGTGNRLYGVYSLPVRANEATIYSISPSGTVNIGVNDINIVLKPGESYSYMTSETLKETNATIKVQYSHTYINHGFIDKRLIGTGFVSPR